MKSGAYPRVGKKNGLGSQDSRHKAVNQAINWTVKCCVFSTHQYSLRKGLSQDKLLSVIPWENGKNMHKAPEGQRDLEGAAQEGRHGSGVADSRYAWKPHREEPTWRSSRSVGAPERAAAMAMPAP